MTAPQLQAAATADESRVLEIEAGWNELSDDALEAALAELRELATSGELRYGYQRKAHTLANTIDAEFTDLPADDEDAEEPPAQP